MSSWRNAVSWAGYSGQWRSMRLSPLRGRRSGGGVLERMNSAGGRGWAGCGGSFAARVVMVVAGWVLLGWMRGRPRGGISRCAGPDSGPGDTVLEETFKAARLGNMGETGDAAIVTASSSLEESLPELDSIPSGEEDECVVDKRLPTFSIS